MQPIAQKQGAAPQSLKALSVSWPALCLLSASDSSLTLPGLHARAVLAWICLLQPVRVLFWRQLHEWEGQDDRTCSIRTGAGRASS